MKQIIDGNIIIDWETGDTEGDRKKWFQAMRLFLKDIKEYAEENEDNVILDIFSKWNIREINIGNFPRINIDNPDEVKK